MILISHEGLCNEFKKLKSMDYFISSIKHDRDILIYCHFSTPYKLSKKILSYGVKIIRWERSPKQCISFVVINNVIIDEFGTKPHQCPSPKESKEVNKSKVHW